MSTAAILPIKSLDRAKQRLASDLEPSARRALVEAMFSDALVALRRSTRLAHVIVVSPDHNAQRIAAGYGADVVSDAEAGHSAAAGRGIARAGELGAARALLVPGDCPLLDPVEVDALIDRPAPAPSVIVVADRHGTGTNALLITPPDGFAPAFGVDSHERHLAQARTIGIPGESVPVASLALDIDTPDDLAALEARLESTRGGAAHTRGMLRQLTRSRG